MANEHDEETLDGRPAEGGTAPVLKPARRSVRWFGRSVRVLGWMSVLSVLLVVLLFSAIQTGLGDGVLASRVRTVLGNTVGPDLTTSIDNASIRIGWDGRLAIEADDVRFLRRAGESEDYGLMTSARSVRLLLDPVPALFGDLKVSEVAIEGITLDARLVGRRHETDWEAVRVDAITRLAEKTFEGLDRVFRMLKNSRTQSIRLTESTIIGIGTDGKAEPIAVDSVVLALSEDGNLAIDGALSVSGQTLAVSGSTVRHPEIDTIDALRVDVTGLERIGAALPSDGGRGRGFGAESAATLTLRAERTPERDGGPSVRADMRFAAGRIMLGGVVSSLDASWLSLGYFPERQTVEILPSALNIGASTLPFTGGIIDLSNLENVDGRGFGIDLLIENARSAPVDSAEPSLNYQAKIFARFFKHRQRLAVDEFVVDSRLGTIFASAGVQFGASSPEISVAATVDRIETAAVKQLWPHWIAKRPRQWAMENVFGGMVHDGTIRVFVPAGRLAAQPERLDLDEGQLQIDFDVERARINIAGDIPPVRDTAGHVRLRGNSLDVDIDAATAYFPSGRTVDLTEGRFLIPRTDLKPLMAELEAEIAGDADAVAELVSYRPIDALERIGYAPDDFSGGVTADVTARFGLIRSQDPPEPVWTAAMQLEEVDVARPIEGRSVTDVNGSLLVDPDKATLDAAASVDGAPLSLAIVQPIRPDTTIEPVQEFTGTLGNDDRAKLAPGLDGLIDGPVSVTVRRTAERVYAGEFDLADARLTVPGLNWSKAAGIAAGAELTATLGEDGISLSELTVAGDGFAIDGGTVEIVDGGLSSARFDQVQLSANDDYSVSIERGEDGYAIDVRGAAIDLRSLLQSLRKKSAATGQADSDAANFDSASIDLQAEVDRAYGFNGEYLSALSARYSASGGTVRGLRVEGVTSSGAAVVATLDPTEAGQALTLTSGDAGAFSRFADIYGRINGGQINLRMVKAGGGPYLGTLELNNFTVINEEQLRQIVVARAQGQVSLNDALNGGIDTTAARFDRGFARLQFGEQGLTIQNGVVRGPEIGATFQGTLFDENGQMNITGTFMPAYGLNRLFAEIPIFGGLLGNGRDRGLFGITFMLAGALENPQLTVNPISAIAPGVFRQIFEF